MYYISILNLLKIIILRTKQIVSFLFFHSTWFYHSLRSYFPFSYFYLVIALTMVKISILIDISDISMPLVISPLAITKAKIVLPDISTESRRKKSLPIYHTFKYTARWLIVLSKIKLTWIKICFNIYSIPIYNFFLRI